MTFEELEKSQAETIDQLKRFVKEGELRNGTVQLCVLVGKDIFHCKDAPVVEIQKLDRQTIKTHKGLSVQLLSHDNDAVKPPEPQQSKKPMTPKVRELVRTYEKGVAAKTVTNSKVDKNQLSITDGTELARKAKDIFFTKQRPIDEYEQFEDYFGTVYLVFVDGSNVAYSARDSLVPHKYLATHVISTYLPDEKVIPINFDTCSLIPVEQPYSRVNGCTIIYTSLVKDDYSMHSLQEKQLFVLMDGDDLIITHCHVINTKERLVSGLMMYDKFQCKLFGPLKEDVKACAVVTVRRPTPGRDKCDSYAVVNASSETIVLNSTSVPVHMTLGSNKEVLATDDTNVVGYYMIPKKKGVVRFAFCNRKLEYVYAFTLIGKYGYDPTQTILCMDQGDTPVSTADEETVDAMTAAFNALEEEDQLQPAEPDNRDTQLIIDLFGAREIETKNDVSLQPSDEEKVKIEKLTKMVKNWKDDAMKPNRYAHTGENKHIHKCKSCKQLYFHYHRHRKGQEHPQFDFQCAYPECDMYYGKGSKDQRANISGSTIYVPKKPILKETHKSKPSGSDQEPKMSDSEIATRIKASYPDDDDLRHFHDCKRCLYRYSHCHYVFEEHKQFDFDCPYEECDMFYGKGTEYHKTNPKHARKERTTKLNEPWPVEKLKDDDSASSDEEILVAAISTMRDTAFKTKMLNIFAESKGKLSKPIKSLAAKVPFKIKNVWNMLPKQQPAIEFPIVKEVTDKKPDVMTKQKDNTRKDERGQDTHYGFIDGAGNRYFMPSKPRLVSKKAASDSELVEQRKDNGLSRGRSLDAEINQLKSEVYSKIPKGWNLKWSPRKSKNAIRKQAEIRRLKTLSSGYSRLPTKSNRGPAPIVLSAEWNVSGSESETLLGNVVSSEFLCFDNSDLEAPKIQPSSTSEKNIRRKGKTLEETDFDGYLSSCFSEVDVIAKKHKGLRKTWDMETRTHSSTTGDLSDAANVLSSRFKVYTNKKDNTTYVSTVSQDYVNMHVCPYNLNMKYNYFDLWSNLQLAEITDSVFVGKHELHLSRGFKTVQTIANDKLWQCEARYFKYNGLIRSGTPIYNINNELCAVITISARNRYFVIGKTPLVESELQDKVAIAQLTEQYGGMPYNVKWTIEEEQLEEYHTVSVSTPKTSNAPDTVTPPTPTNYLKLTYTSDGSLSSDLSGDSEDLRSDDQQPVKVAQYLDDRDYLESFFEVEKVMTSQDVLDAWERLDFIPAQLLEMIQEKETYHNLISGVVKEANAAKMNGLYLPTGELHGDAILFVNEDKPQTYGVEVRWFEEEILRYDYDSGARQIRVNCPIDRRLVAIKVLLAILKNNYFTVITLSPFWNIQDLRAGLNLTHLGLSNPPGFSSVLVIKTHLEDPIKKKLGLFYGNNPGFVKEQQFLSCMWDVYRGPLGNVYVSSIAGMLQAWDAVVAIRPSSTVNVEKSDKPSDVTDFKDVIDLTNGQVATLQLESLSILGMAHMDDVGLRTCEHVIQKASLNFQHKNKRCFGKKPTNKDAALDVADFGDGVRHLAKLKEGEVVFMFNPLIKAAKLFIVRELKKTLNSRDAMFITLQPIAKGEGKTYIQDAWKGIPGASGSGIYNMKGELVGNYGLVLKTRDYTINSLPSENGVRCIPHIPDVRPEASTTRFFANLFQTVINETLNGDHKYFLAVSPTGSGKTTVGTAECAKKLKDGEKLLVLQPTTLAVRNAYNRIVTLLDMEGAGSTKYKLRYEIGSSNTKPSGSVGNGPVEIVLMTMGAALYRLHSIRSTYKIIVLDEIHEEFDPTVLASDIIFTQMNAKVVHMSATPRKYVGARVLCNDDDSANTKFKITNRDMGQATEPSSDYFIYPPKKSTKEPRYTVPMRSLDYGVCMFFCASRRECVNMMNYAKKNYSKEGRKFLAIYRGADFKASDISGDCWIFCTDIMGKSYTAVGCRTVCDPLTEFKPVTRVSHSSTAIEYSNTLQRRIIDVATSLQRRGRTGRTCQGEYYTPAGVNPVKAHTRDPHTLISAMLLMYHVKNWTPGVIGAHYDQDLITEMKQFEWLLPGELKSHPVMVKAYQAMSEMGIAVQMDLIHKLETGINVNGDPVYLYLTPVLSKEQYEKNKNSKDRLRTSSAAGDIEWFKKCAKYWHIVETEEQAATFRLLHGFNLTSVKETIDQVDNEVKCELYLDEVVEAEDYHSLGCGTSYAVMAGLGVTLLSTAALMNYCSTSSPRFVTSFAVHDKELLKNHAKWLIEKFENENKAPEILSVGFRAKLVDLLSQWWVNMNKIVDTIKGKLGIEKHATGITLAGVQAWLTAKLAMIDAASLTTFNVSALGSLGYLVGFGVVSAWFDEMAIVLTKPIAAVILIMLNGMAVYYAGVPAWIALVGVQLICYVVNCIITRRSQLLTVTRFGQNLSSSPWTFIFSTLAGGAIGHSLLTANAIPSAMTFSAGDLAVQGLTGYSAGGYLGQAGNSILVMKHLYMLMRNLLSGRSSAETTLSGLSFLVATMSMTWFSFAVAVVVAFGLVVIRYAYAREKKEDGIKAKPAPDGSNKYVDDFYVNFDEMAINVMSFGAYVANPLSALSFVVGWLGSRINGTNESLPDIFRKYAGVPLAFSIVSELFTFLTQERDTVRTDSFNHFMTVPGIIIAGFSAITTVHYTCTSSLSDWVMSGLRKICMVLQWIWIKLRDGVRSVLGSGGKTVGKAAANAAIDTIAERIPGASLVVKETQQDSKLQDFVPTYENLLTRNFDMTFLDEYALNQWKSSNGLSVAESFHYSLRLAQETEAGAWPPRMLVDDFVKNYDKVDVCRCKMSSTPIDVFKLSGESIKKVLEGFILHDFEINNGIITIERNSYNIKLESSYKEDAVALRVSARPRHTHQDT